NPPPRGWNTGTIRVTTRTYERGQPGDPTPFGAAHRAELTSAQCLGTVIRSLAVGFADVDADHHLDLDCLYNFLSVEGPLVTMPMRDGRMRFLAQVHTSATAGNAEPTLDELQEIIDRRVGGIRVLRPHWLSYFQIHSAQVPQYRWGRVLLAGDAGHIHSPAGGRGMNTGMQDAFNLAWKLAAVVHGEAGDILLDSYNAERHPIAQQVLAYSTRLTRMWQLSGPSRRIRDVALGLLTRIGPARRAMVNDATEVTINYMGGPIAVGDRPRGAKVAAGQHFPYVSDPAVYRQLRAVFGADNLGHTIVTVASEHRRPAPGAQGATQVLVARDNTPVPDYDTVIADPHQALAHRLGLKNGGRLVVRPDGYIGVITTIDDTMDIAKYFTLIAS
nr:FAD-dependent monooxygenase [Actinomycetes bacterium]